MRDSRLDVGFFDGYSFVWFAITVASVAIACTSAFTVDVFWDHTNTASAIMSLVGFFGVPVALVWTLRRDITESPVFPLSILAIWASGAVIGMVMHWLYPIMHVWWMNRLVTG